jgi:hypothetical protein
VVYADERSCPLAPGSQDNVLLLSGQGTCADAFPLFSRVQTLLGVHALNTGLWEVVKSKGKSRNAYSSTRHLRFSRWDRILQNKCEQLTDGCTRFREYGAERENCTFTPPVRQRNVADFIEAFPCGDTQPAHRLVPPPHPHPPLCCCHFASPRTSGVYVPPSIPNPVSSHTELDRDTVWCSFPQ